MSAEAESVPTEFVGFSSAESDATAVSAVPQKDEILVAVDRSPFYGGMGGQVSDTGELITSAGRKLPVRGAVKKGGTFYLSLPAGAQFPTPDQVKLKIDFKPRRRIEANH